MLFSKKPKYEYVIAGLGNPGDKYEATRHNVGFRCIDALASEIATEKEKEKFHAIIMDAQIKGHSVLLCKPLTFMNKSGTAISEIIKVYKIPPENVIVISDDVSMDAGKLRIRKNGSHGGHNGLRDIFELCGTDNIPRIKVGVGQKPHPDYDLAAWVLGKPSAEDNAKIHKAEENCVQAIITAVTCDFQTAMNKYNR